MQRAAGKAGTVLCVGNIDATHVCKGEPANDDNGYKMSDYTSYRQCYRL